MTASEDIVDTALVKENRETIDPNEYQKQKEQIIRLKAFINQILYRVFKFCAKTRSSELIESIRTCINENDISNQHLGRLDEMGLVTDLYGVDDFKSKPPNESQTQPSKKAASRYSNKSSDKSFWIVLLFLVCGNVALGKLIYEKYSSQASEQKSTQKRRPDRNAIASSPAKVNNPKPQVVRASSEIKASKVSNSPSPKIDSPTESSSKAADIMATIINLNGRLCARVLDIQADSYGYVAECILYRGGDARQKYRVSEDATKVYPIE